MKKKKRCWEFFHCREEEQKICLLPQVDEWRCWRVNIACCRIPRDTPAPLSVKKIVCKACAYYKEYSKVAS